MSQTPPDKAEINWQEKRVHKDFDAYFNAQFNAHAAPLLPGECQISKVGNTTKEQMFVAHLGRGIVVFIYDSALHCGAASYLLMPRAALEIFPKTDEALRPQIVQALRPLDEALGGLYALGGRDENFTIRLFGGGMLEDENNGGTQDAGTKNYVFVREYLSRKGLAVHAEDIGGRLIQRLHIFPAGGKVVRMMLRRDSDFEMLQGIESAYHQKF